MLRLALHALYTQLRGMEYISVINIVVALIPLGECVLKEGKLIKVVRATKRYPPHEHALENGHLCELTHLCNFI